MRTLRRTQVAVLGLVAMLVSACGTLPMPTPAATEQAAHGWIPVALPAAAIAADLRAVQVAPVRAAPAHAGTQLAYRDHNGTFGYFAHHAWRVSPARELERWSVAALERAGGFAAVVAPGGSGAVDLRLEIELVELLQDFTATPSRAHLELRLQLLGERGRVLAQRRLALAGEASGDDPRGGVDALNALLGDALVELVDFVHSGAATR